MQIRVTAVIPLLIAVAWCVPLLSQVIHAATGQPNIIFINADDVGIADVQATGGQFPTPNIDALASGGMQFQNCYAIPLCAPSRCQVLTGRYPFRTGFNSQLSSFNISPASEVMISQVLESAGYATASVGKWNLSLFPQAWGFDEQLVAKWGGYTSEQSSTYNLNGKTVNLPEDAYLPDIMHEFAVDFIRRNYDQPFFLYYPMLHVHTPIIPTPDSQPGADYPTLYADNVAYMDKLVGQLMDELDRLGLREETIVVFTGDNGTANHVLPYFIPTVYGRELSGMKAAMREGGSRVPLIVNWQGTTPAGVINQDLVDFSDFFLTFAELANAPLPAGLTLDSRSFALQILGQPSTSREWVYVELKGNSYARGPRYKLTNAGDLFDLADAPWTELPVPANSKDQTAIDARATLQAVLDEHPAIKPVGVDSDFSGDGHQDILLQDRMTGDRLLWVMKPFNTQPRRQVALGTIQTDWRIAGTGDFNGDGKPDIVRENTANAARLVSFMDGTRYMGFAHLTDVGMTKLGWRIAGVGDFNGDGKPDLVGENTIYGRRVVRFMDGTAGVDIARLSDTGLEGPDWNVVGVGDFNGDGMPDLVWQNNANGLRIVRFMDGVTDGDSMPLSLPGVAWPDWRIAKIGDFNADGKPDIVLQNVTSGRVTVWLMNGVTAGLRRDMPQPLAEGWEICN